MVVEFLSRGPNVAPCTCVNSLTPARFNPLHPAGTQMSPGEQFNQFDARPPPAANMSRDRRTWGHPTHPPTHPLALPQPPNKRTPMLHTKRLSLFSKRHLRWQLHPNQPLFHPPPHPTPLLPMPTFTLPSVCTAAVNNMCFESFDTFTMQCHTTSMMRTYTKYK